MSCFSRPSFFSPPVALVEPWIVWSLVRDFSRGGAADTDKGKITQTKTPIVGAINKTCCRVDVDEDFGNSFDWRHYRLGVEIPFAK
ncbi:hypothetical protein RclHR1_05610010 [Rhizophagus clarus]|uniref:Uncharacterized protein n=1 Tax=Rhizophagus clarus TaxID=94130 RepID=A0A2Z6RU29_9GLOM|nr:hypothetical protein RclHR1_05610010 [Rhizophagus clarus]GES87607.1 hypothetical protein RCL_jg26495.t1 [Rhizophagus clarus]